MPKAPDSYRDQKRPPLLDALRAEGDVSIEVAMAALERRGYFEPRPRPWQLGSHDRGHGHASWVVLDRFGDVVTGPLERVDAELIINAVNACEPSRGQ